MDQIESRPRRTPAWLRITRAVVFTLLVVVVLFGYQLSRLYTDWLWFGELGRPEVYAGVLSARLLLFFGFGTLCFAVLYFNIWMAARLNRGIRRPRGVDPEREQMAAVARIAARWVVVAGAVLVSFLVGGNASTHWSEYLLFTRGIAFGTVDPVFGQDVGFYIFRLPFLNYLQGLALFVLAACMVGAAVVHYGERAVEFIEGSLPAIAPHVRKHLLTLAGVVALVVAWGHLLARYDILFADNGAFFGAGYTDLHARLPAQYVQVFFMALVALACFVNTRRGQLFLLPGLALGAWAVASALTVSVWPGLVQRFRVVPNQFTAEEPYIKRDIEFTRRGYGLERVKEQTVGGMQELTASDLSANRPTIDSVRLWDWPQLGAVFEAKQALKQYYGFRLPPGTSTTIGDYNIDVDRYRFGADYRQVMLAPRELFPDGLPPQAQTWVNRRLQYTHGYGAVMSPVNRVDVDGLPEYFLGQIPVTSRVAGLELTRPQVYYGELSQDYVFVNTRPDEFDYPGPSGNQTTRYTGRGGVRLGSGLRRLAWSMRLGDPNLLLSGDLSPQSRVLFRRAIRDRVQTLAPFLNWDNDPYVVLNGGKLSWIMDAYTLSDRYPYSRQTAVGGPRDLVTQSFSYIRNSVKAVVDAYDGSVTLYVSDASDPIIRCWQRIFPKLFVPLDQMPAELRAHVRYPEDLFRIQRDIYAIYHITDPRVYYGKEDQWSVPADPASATQSGEDGAGKRMMPYYVVMRLPRERSEEFLLMSPYTPLATQNMSAWMCARCDPENYGELLVYRFPRGVNVNGPQQIIAQINSQEDISKTVSLLDQRGSKVSWGNLLAIPIDNSLLYALPLYVQASGAAAAAIPEISQVVLATGDRIVMRPTLEDAVAALSATRPLVRSADRSTVAAPPSATPSGAPEPGPGRGAASLPDLAQRATSSFSEARRIQKEYDAALDRLGKALEELQREAKRTGR